MSRLDAPPTPLPEPVEGLPEPVEGPAKRPTLARRQGGLRNWPWTLTLGVFILGAVLLILLVTPLIAPHDPAAQDLANRLQPGGGEHLIGTDQLGRDLLTRVMYGGRFSVTIAAITLAICAVFGTLLGFLCARRRGVLDEVVMRVSDVLLAFPEMIVAMFIVSILGASEVTLIVALVIGGWTPFARLARGVALEIEGKDFIEAARGLGCSTRFIVLRHVLPNALSPLLAHAALRFGHKLITVGALSFLGLGVQPPAADWGSMLADAQPFMTRAPWLVLWPGLAIFVTALSVTLIGQGLNTKRQYH